MKRLLGPWPITTLCRTWWGASLLSAKLPRHSSLNPILGLKQRAWIFFFFFFFFWKERAWILAISFGPAHYCSYRNGDGDTDASPNSASWFMNFVPVFVRCARGSSWASKARWFGKNGQKCFTGRFLHCIRQQKWYCHGSVVSLNFQVDTDTVFF